MILLYQIASLTVLHATNIFTFSLQRHRHVTMEARSERFKSVDEKEKKQKLSCVDDDGDDDKKPRGMGKETKLLHVQLHHHVCLHF